MAAVLLPEALIGIVSGSGYKLLTYEVGTTTDLTTYSDFALTTPNANPLIADSNGLFGPVFLDATGNDPKIVLTDADDVEIFTIARFPIEDITTLSSDLDTVEADVDTLEGEMAANDASISTLESEVATLTTEAADFESRIAALEGASAPTSPVAMAYFDGENNPTFSQSTGFDSVSKSSDGVFDLVFTTARANANYIVVVACGDPVTNNEALDSEVVNRATTGFTINTFRNTEGSPQEQDRNGISVVVFDLD